MPKGGYEEEPKDRVPTAKELLDRALPIASHAPSGIHFEPKATDLSPVKPKRWQGGDVTAAEQFNRVIPGPGVGSRSMPEASAVPNSHNMDPTYRTSLNFMDIDWPVSPEEQEVIDRVNARINSSQG